MDSSPPGSSVREISQARVLESVAISFSRGSSQPRDQACISLSRQADSLPLSHRDACGYDSWQNVALCHLELLLGCPASYRLWDHLPMHIRTVGLFAILGGSGVTSAVVRDLMQKFSSSVREWPVWRVTWLGPIALKSHRENPTTWWNGNLSSIVLLTELLKGIQSKFVLSLF